MYVLHQLCVVSSTTDLFLQLSRKRGELLIECNEIGSGRHQKVCIFIVAIVTILLVPGLYPLQCGMRYQQTKFKMGVGRGVSDYCRHLIHIIGDLNGFTNRISAVEIFVSNGGREHYLKRTGKCLLGFPVNDVERKYIKD